MNNRGVEPSAPYENALYPSIPTSEFSYYSTSANPPPKPATPPLPYYPPTSTSRYPQPFLHSPTSELYCLGGKVDTKNFLISKCGPAEQWASIYEDSNKRISCPMASIGPKIYIVDSGYYQKAFSEFDVRTKAFTSLPDIPQKLDGCAMTSLQKGLLLSGGKRLLYEGQNRKPKSQNDAFYFDIEHAKWEPVSSMHKARYRHVMVTGNELVYTIGGYENLAGGATVEEFHHARNQWVKTDVRINTFFMDGSLPQTAAYHGGVVYVCTPSKFFRVAPKEGLKEMLPPPPNSRSNSLVSYNGKLLSIGGCLDTISKSWDKTGMVYAFDARSRAWERLADLDRPRKRHTCVVVNYI